MTQSNPNNSSAVEKIKINLPIYIGAQDGDIFIQKNCFSIWHNPIPISSKADLHLDPVVPEHFGLPRGFKITIH